MIWNGNKETLLPLKSSATGARQPWNDIYDPQIICQMGFVVDV